LPKIIKHDAVEHFRIERIIWNDDQLDTKAKIVALCLIHHKGKKGGFPEQETKAKETKLSIESVKRAVKDLKTFYIIESSRLKRRNNDYWFLI
jgi:hypothetical protein